MSSMIEHFKDLLTEGRMPADPFEEALERSRKEHRDAKEAARLAWNNRIMNHYGGNDQLRQRMLSRRARRAGRIRFR